MLHDPGRSSTFHPASMWHGGCRALSSTTGEKLALFGVGIRVLGARAFLCAVSPLHGLTGAGRGTADSRDDTRELLAGVAACRHADAILALRAE
jgi:hypothetical protein